MHELEKHIDMGPNVRRVAEGDGGLTVRLEDPSGEGMMRIRTVFDGAYLLYNDFQMDACVSGFAIRDRTPLLAIDHCRVGRMETEWKPGTCTYLQEKELRLDNRRHHSGTVVFPLRHYHGITLGFDLSVAEGAIQKLFPGFPVRLSEIQRKYASGDRPFVLKNEPGIERILCGLYSPPAAVRREYFILKTLELLVYLDALTVPGTLEERPCFHRGRVEKIKAACRLITKDLTCRYTTEEVARRVGLSPTALKSGFRQIYGDSMYSYLRRVRLHTAAGLLRAGGGKSVGEIALAVGYENQGKFSTAFRDLMGVTPLEYRRST